MAENLTRLASPFWGEVSEVLRATEGRKQRDSICPWRSTRLTVATMAVLPAGALDSRRFIFVTGKGGVGKTTVCAALALAMAQRGKRVLVAMTGVQERLSSLFGSAPIGHDIQPVANNIWATKIEPERAMEEYGLLVLKVKALTRVLFDNKYTNGFFRAVPGLFDWALLGKAWYHTTEQRKDGSWLYDVVLFDGPSTGHGLDMLRVPKVLVELAPPGVLRRDAEAAWSLFKDAARSGVVVATLPQAMPVTEACELIETVTDELSLTVLMVVLNAVLSPLFSQPERRALLADDELERIARSANAGANAGAIPQGDSAAAWEGLANATAWLANAARRAAHEQLQQDERARLQQRFTGTVRELPYLLGDAGTTDGVRKLAQFF